MFELVLHHDYRGGEALDLSGNDNHGRLSHPSSAEGRNPGTTALCFDGNNDRVIAFPSESLTDLGAIRVSAWIWVQEVGKRRNLLEGFLSFAFMIEEDNSLQAKVYDGTKWDGIWTPPNTVPLKEWIEVQFIYDGIDTIALCLNDELIARRYRHLGRVQSVAWPFGLNIGAWPDANSYSFMGKIDEVKLWRDTRFDT